MNSTSIDQRPFELASIIAGWIAELAFERLDDGDVDIRVARQQFPRPFDQRTRGTALRTSYHDRHRLLSCCVIRMRPGTLPCKFHPMGQEETAMPAKQARIPVPDGACDDMGLVLRALARDADAFRTIIKQNNQRLYRLARAIVRDDAEAEDVVQETYMLAFAHLDAFHGGSSLTTWLSRIAINEALGRLRTKRRAPGSGLALPVEAAEIIPFPLNMDGSDPERTMAQRQILHLVEEAADNLPEAFRTVFVARVIEAMSVDETAELLGLQPQTVKTRLHRARALLRKELDAKIGPILLDAFPFAGRRCGRLTLAVLKRLGFAE
jgi:RNA polymerase sigma-70 factor (ECF subfamily)